MAEPGGQSLFFPHCLLPFSPSFSTPSRIRPSSVLRSWTAQSSLSCTAKLSSFKKMASSSGLTPRRTRSMRRRLFSSATFRAAAWISALNSTPVCSHSLSRPSTSWRYSFLLARDRRWLSLTRARCAASCGVSACGKRVHFGMLAKVILLKIRTLPDMSSFYSYQIDSASFSTNSRCTVHRLACRPSRSLLITRSLSVWPR